MEIIFLIVGLLAGFLACYFMQRSKNDGVIELDLTNPNEPYYRLLLSQEQFSQIPKHDTVTFKVKKDGHFTRQKQGY